MAETSSSDMRIKNLIEYINISQNLYYDICMIRNQTRVRVREMRRNRFLEILCLHLFKLF